MTNDSLDPLSLIEMIAKDCEYGAGQRARQRAKEYLDIIRQHQKAQGDEYPVYDPVRGLRKGWLENNMGETLANSVEVNGTEGAATQKPVMSGSSCAPTQNDKSEELQRHEISVIDECRSAFEENTKRIALATGFDADEALRTKPNGNYKEPSVFSAWQGWEDCWNLRTPKPVSVTQCKQAATNAHNKGDLAWDSDTVTKAVLYAAGVIYE